MPYVDMLPPESAEARSQNSFYIAFIVEHREPIEVWIDDVELE